MTLLVSLISPARLRANSEMPRVNADDLGGTCVLLGLGLREDDKSALVEDGCDPSPPDEHEPSPFMTLPTHSADTKSHWRVVSLCGVV